MNSSQATDILSYDPGNFYDELFAAQGSVRPEQALLGDALSQMGPPELLARQQAAETALLRMGITFQVYGDEGKGERVFPFDLVPRVITSPEWNRIERGLKQRITALNLFVDDIYHDKKILKDKIVPDWVVYSSKGYLEPCEGMNPPLGIWCHICGSDLIRDEHGDFYVLEDNLRCPSGVSYVLANRMVMKRTLPEVFARMNVRPVADYPDMLLQTLRSVSPHTQGAPRIVVLSPGIYNSAYFEHAFLAQQTGAELVEGRDLVVSDGFVCMKTTRGLQRVDVIYRRINDDYLDPRTFRPDSVLGVAGLMEVFKAGRVAIANMPGPGVADDKVVYAFVPDMIKYYLDEDPILPNVPTYLCSREEERNHVLQNLDKLVVKESDGAGGYGMLIGPASTKAEQDTFADHIKANPRGYIAQPTLSLSRSPILLKDGTLGGRHLDLRPFVLYGKDIKVLPGGLTRVAMREGSLVVNSSQGGGSKDTWVLNQEGGVS
ncbi:MAG: circularly permuted type 2 ATP-grasp protein [Verrucomicrobia bacterium]|nr:circularly permuted type 2 ATP-grasp protein [Verrucomicrobiota bacterium]MCH8525827.1 circularly permuted type 2 ATP-grasp protein [Kiritimatiellia bacterium]